MYDVSALGELLIDFTPSGQSAQKNPLYEQNPGGAPANVLVALSRLGKKAAFLGMVGRDQFGSFLRMTLENDGIETRGLKFCDNVNTTLAFVHLDAAGDRSFSFYRNPGADVMLRPEDVAYEIIKESRVFHFGSVSMTAEPAKSATIAAARFAKENGVVVSYDPNYRPLLWKSKEAAQSVIREGLAFADILKISDQELELATGTADPEEGAISLCNKGIKIIFVTLGPKGCFYCHPNGSGVIPSYPVDVVDTTGSGDAFMGAALSFLCSKTPSELAQIPDPEMRNIVAFSCAAGALTATRKGAIPGIPYLDDIQTFLNGF